MKPRSAIAREILPCRRGALPGVWRSICSSVRVPQNSPVGVAAPMRDAVLVTWSLYPSLPRLPPFSREKKYPPSRRAGQA